MIMASRLYSGWIFSRIYLFVIFFVHGTFRILLQHQSSKASIFFLSVLSTVQVSAPYIATGNTRAYTSLLLVPIETSLLFHILSSFLNATLPSANLLLISLLHVPVLSISVPRKIKVSTTSNDSFPTINLSTPVVITLVFVKVRKRPNFSLTSITLSRRKTRTSFVVAIKVVSSAYLKLLTFKSPILIPSFASSRHAYLIMASL